MVKKFLVVLSIVVIALVFVKTEVFSSEQNIFVYRVIDVDTIEDRNGNKYRLKDVDGPEIFKYECDAELKLGLVGKHILENLILKKQVCIEIFGKDKYNRTIIIVFYDNKNINKLIVDSNLAVKWVKNKKHEWC